MKNRSLDLSSSIDIPFEMVPDAQTEAADPIQAVEETEEVDINYYKWMSMLSIWPYM